MDGPTVYAHSYVTPAAVIVRIVPGKHMEGQGPAGAGVGLLTFSVSTLKNELTVATSTYCFCNKNNLEL